MQTSIAPYTTTVRIDHSSDGRVIVSHFKNATFAVGLYDDYCILGAVGKSLILAPFNPVKESCPPGSDAFIVVEELFRMRVSYFSVRVA